MAGWQAALPRTQLIAFQAFSCNQFEGLVQMISRSEWNPEFGSLIELLLQRGTQTPDRRAFSFLNLDGDPADVRTYGDLDQQARAIAATLQAQIAPGDRALLLYPSGLDFVPAFFGCLYAGVVAVPACPPRPGRPMPQLEAIVRDAKPSIVLTASSMHAEAERRFAEVGELKDLPQLATDRISCESAAEWRKPSVDGRTLAFLQYTSGSTSTPKGVMVCHRNLVHNLELILGIVGCGQESTSLCWVPPYHDMGLIGGILAPIYGCFQSIQMSPMAFLQRPLSWVQAISRYRADASTAPNFAYEMCAARCTPEVMKDLDLSCWRVALCGSEPIRMKTLERFAECFAPSGFRMEAFNPTYGLAEATLIVSGYAGQRRPLTRQLQPAGSAERLSAESTSSAGDSSIKVSCGHPLPDQEVVIVDPSNFRRCPEGTEGEVWLRGPSVTLGYWQRKEETERCFRARIAHDDDGPFFRTGDLGILANNELYITGRIKELIIVRGRNHYPQDIEQTVEHCHPALRPVSGAAVAIEAAGEERLAIVHEIERTQRHDLDIDVVAAAIRAAVSRRHDLDVYAVALLKTGSLPRTSSGKIQRAACRAGLLSGALEAVAIWSQGPLNSESVQPVSAGKTAGSAILETVTAGKTSSEIEQWLVERLAVKLNIPAADIDTRVPLEQFGLDSQDAVVLSGDLEQFLGCRLPPTLFYECGTIEALTQRVKSEAHTATGAGQLQSSLLTRPPRNGHLNGKSADPNKRSRMSAGKNGKLSGRTRAERNGSHVRESLPMTVEPTVHDNEATSQLDDDLLALERLVQRGDAMAEEVAHHATRLRQAVDSLRTLQARYMERERLAAEPIAIVGMGCRFPGGVLDSESFWRLLSTGTDAVIEAPKDRWNTEQLYDPDSARPGKMSTRWGGFLSDIDKFDAQFFGISPREAVSMDPQQRMFLEVAWEALEQGGQAPDKLFGSQTGVFLGICSNDYASLMANAADPERIDAYTGTGGAFSVASGRLSYVLGLQGPNLAVDTACSSSLVAVHLAVQSLRNGECRMALAGGVNVLLSPEAMIYFSKVQAMSADGRCKTFDASANGYVRGEGCGVIVLKRISDALADGDNVLAVVRGSAINHDGRSNGLTAPNGSAQEAVIRSALASAGLAPADVSYVEAHGTGTALGDPIEARALGAVYGAGRADDDRLVIGSVKTNIGHLEAAAGIAGLIKTVLALRHEQIPPNLHFKTINPHISLAELPLAIPTSPQAWKSPSAPRRAGISSFGFGGTNAHIVLEEAPRTTGEAQRADRPLHILTLSARQPHTLRVLAERFEEQIAGGESLADVCHSANVGRSQFDHRAAFVAGSALDLKSQLAEFRAGRPAPGVTAGQLRVRRRLKIAFLFTGQGSQYAGMGRELYDTQPTFRRELDRCDKLLRTRLGRSLLDILYPAQAAHSPIDETAFAQPALFALEYSLAQMWRSWGVEPSAVMGHSIGEYVAACVAGLISLEDGMSLIAERGRLMQTLPTGARMAAVLADPQRVAAAIQPYAARVSIAAINGDENVVISGGGAEIEALLEEFSFAGVPTQPLVVSHAFHSPLLEPILDHLAAAAGQVAFHDLRLQLVSNRTGNFATRDELASPEYWRRHAREPVQFAAGIRTLHQAGYDVFLEIGPTPTLTGMARRCLPQVEAIWLPSMRKGRNAWQQVLDTLSSLYTAGAEIDWRGFDRDYPRRKVALPTYPFQRERFWFEATPRATPGRKAEQTSAADGTAHALHAAERNGAVGSQAKSELRTAFEVDLSVEATDYLREHKVHGRHLLPGAGFVALAWAAAKNAFPGEQFELEHVRLSKALIVDEGETTKLHVELQGDAGGSITFQATTSAPAATNGQAEMMHAQGELRPCRPADGQPPTASLDVAGLRAVRGDEITGEQIYASCAARKIELGPGFRWVLRAWKAPTGIVAELARPAANHQDCGSPVPPGLIDACFQLVGLALAEQGTWGQTLVPVRIERVQCAGEIGQKLWGRVTIRSQASNDDRTLSDVVVVDSEGRVVLQLNGVQLVAVDAAAMFGAGRLDVRQHLYEVQWEERSRSTVADRGLKSQSGDWLVLADGSDYAADLVRRLTERQERCVVVKQGTDYSVARTGEVTLSPDVPAHFQRLLENEFIAQGRGCRGVILLQTTTTSRSDEVATTESLWSAQLHGSAAALHLLQAIVRQSVVGRPEIWLVTRGSQSIAGESHPSAVAQAPLWGMGRVLTLEHPELHAVCVDIDPQGSGDDAGELFAEINAPDGENQIALRGGTRFVARLAMIPSLEAANVNGSAPAWSTGQPYHLEIPRRGVLDNLVWSPLARSKPGPGQIEIEVHATGLNFRDVLNALGLYPGDPGPLGGECSGRVSAVGSGVQNLAVGDEVLAIAPGSFGSHVVTDAALAARKLASWTFDHAASVPIAFLTVHYGLRRIAKIQRGDRVLIHAATGGVGLAAVQIAQQAGAEIFATAGNPTKREHLRSLGIQHVMDSRSTAFADEIMQITGGRGVDIVLNSLAGETISKSLAVLAPGGRFIELGKTEIWDAARVAQERPGTTYVPVALDQLAAEQPALVGEMLHELLTEFVTDRLRPVPTRSFAIHEAKAAFRHMAQAKHIGKVIVRHSPHEVPVEASPPKQLRADASYLITGGLGALGLVVARWAVERGARHVVLAGRTEPSTAACAAIRELEQQGARIVTVRADITNRNDVARLVASTKEHGLPSLRGVIHAAGILDDGVLIQQNWERFRRVYAPKIAGAWNLHQETLALPLDFFVMFSSVASLTGSPGQGNYAAANAFLDALAHHRQALGLPALSINWGPWTVGMAAGRDRETDRWRTMGVTPIDQAAGLDALDRLVLEPTGAQVGVLPIDWRRWVQVFTGGRRALPLLERVAPQTGPSEAARASACLRLPVRDELLSLPIERRLPQLEEYLRRQVARALDWASDQLDIHQPINTLGFDSLMAVEVKNRMEMDLGIQFNLASFLQGPTIHELAPVVLQSMTADLHADSSVNNTEQLLDRIDALTDAEVDSLLSELIL